MTSDLNVTKLTFCLKILRQCTIQQFDRLFLRFYFIFMCVGVGQSVSHLVDFHILRVINLGVHSTVINFANQFNRTNRNCSGNALVALISRNLSCSVLILSGISWLGVWYLTLKNVLLIFKTISENL